MPHKPTDLKVNDLVIWHAKNNGVNQPMSGWVVAILKVGDTHDLDLSQYNTSYFGPGFDVVRQGELRVIVRIPQPAGKPILLMPDVRLLRMAGPPERTHGSPAAMQPGKSIHISSRGGSDATVRVDDKMITNIKTLNVELSTGEPAKVSMVAYSPELELNGYIVSVEPFDPLAEEESE